MRPRFFLGVVDHGAGLGSQAPLVLKAGTLTGLGQVSDARGWSNIRFACGLSPARDRATTFTSAVLSPVGPAAAAPAAVRAASGAQMAWFVDGTSPAALVHGVRATDDRDFYAACAPRSGQLELRLTQTARWLHAGDYTTVSINAGIKTLLYVARGVPDQNLGVAIPVVALAATDPLIAQMAAGTELQLTIGADTVYSVSLSGGAAAIGGFARLCAGN